MVSIDLVETLLEKRSVVAAGSFKGFDCVVMLKNTRCTEFINSLLYSVVFSF